MKDAIKEKLVELTKKHEEKLNHYHRFNFHEIQTRRQNIDFVKELYDDCINELLDLDMVGQNTFLTDFGVGDKGKPFKFNNKIIIPPTHVINFNLLYASTIIKLYDDGLLTFNNEAFGNVITTIIRNRKEIKKEHGSDNVWFLTKIIINWTYGELGSEKSKYNVSPFRMISLYCHGLFNTLIEMCPNSIVKIYVDEIYISHYENDYVKRSIHHILDKLGLPYEIEKL
jgi:hypothetical protein